MRNTKKSKSVAIRESFDVSRHKNRQRKMYAGVALAVVLASCGVAIVLSRGGFVAGGVPAFIVFAGAFLVAVYSSTKLFSALLENRDAKRFLRERIFLRSEGVLQAAFSFFGSGYSQQNTRCIKIGGYCPEEVNGALPLFCSDDKGSVYSTHYESSVFIDLPDELLWYIRRFQLDAPQASFYEEGGSISYREITSFSRVEIPLMPIMPGRKEVPSYPYLSITTKHGGELLFSLAHYDPLEEEKDQLQEEEFLSLSQMIRFKQGSLYAQGG